jgi:hypothetical protein
VLAVAAVFEQVRLRARPFQREINETFDEELILALVENLDPLLVLQKAQSNIATDLEWTSRGRRSQ